MTATRLRMLIASLRTPDDVRLAGDVKVLRDHQGKYRIQGGRLSMGGPFKTVDEVMPHAIERVKRAEASS